MYFVVGNLRGVERASLAEKRDKGDRMVRGLLAPHSAEELEALLHEEGAETLVIQDRETFQIVGLLLYYTGACPAALSYLEDAIASDPSRPTPPEPFGVVELCCIQPGPWQGSYPDLHARMILKLREQGTTHVYGMCHVDNPALRKHQRLGYEIVTAHNGEAVEIVRSLHGNEGPARYYLLRLDVNTALQDQLCEAMRARSVPYINIDLPVICPA